MVVLTTSLSDAFGGFSNSDVCWRVSTCAMGSVFSSNAVLVARIDDGACGSFMVPENIILM